jgi:hypothetical protein
MKTSKETRVRLRTLLEKASLGPWKTGTHAQDAARIEGPVADGSLCPGFVIFDEGGHTDEDAALIAESRNALADLLDDLDKLETWETDNRPRTRE